MNPNVRGKKPTPAKRSPQEQVMQKLFRLYERAERLEARMIAKAMRIPAKEQAMFITII